MPSLTKRALEIGDRDEPDGVRVTANSPTVRAGDTSVSCRVDGLYLRNNGRRCWALRDARRPRAEEREKNEGCR